MSRDIPIFILSRDRLNCLQELLTWLESIGHENTYIIDNDSSYEPLLEFYETIDYEIFMMENIGPIAPWRVPRILDMIEQKSFIVTDPDLVPSDECPEDVIDRMAYVLDRNPTFDKVGPSLHIFDLPDHYAHKDQAIKWEKQFWNNRGPDKTWSAPIDTTFALNRAGTNYKLTDALRLDRPYTFKHLPWYLDFDNLPEDEAYYIGHLNPQISNWNRIELPKSLI